MIVAAQSDPVVAREIHERLIELHAAPLRKLLTQAQVRGEIRSGVDLDTVLDMLVGTMFYRVLLQTRPLHSGQIDAALDIMFTGLR